MIISRSLAVATPFVLAACQQLPTGLPYSVTDDCTVQRRAAAPSPGGGFSFGFGGMTLGGSPSSGYPGGGTMAAPATASSGAPMRAAPAATTAATIPRPSTSDSVSTPSPRTGSPSPGPRRSGGPMFGFNFPVPSPASQPDIADEVANTGPQFPSHFSMSCAPVHGFVRGGWPVVIDYQPAGGNSVVLEIHTSGADQPHVVQLDGRARRQLVKVELPQTLGATPQVALFLVRSIKPDGTTGGGLQMFGLGAGPKAVGSVAIDQVDFRPGTMRVSQKQKASYSFFSRSDFNRSVVEILRVQRAAGEIKVSLARSTPVPVVINRGTWIGKPNPLTWDGLDGRNQVSSGPHLLQVRAWLNAQDERDWVAAWSQNTVVVTE